MNWYDRKPFTYFPTTEFTKACGKVEQKVSEAVDRIRKVRLDQDGVFIGHSGGKDSVLVTRLVDLAFGLNNVPVVHNPKPTGVDNQVHPLTQTFLYELAAKRPILFSPEIPLRYQTQIDGTRIAEWNREDGRSVDVIKNGESVSRKEMELYMSNGLFGRNFVYPIYDWSDVEVWAAIYVEHVAYSPEYDL